MAVASYDSRCPVQDLVVASDCYRERFAFQRKSPRRPDSEREVREPLSSAPMASTRRGGALIVQVGSFTAMEIEVVLFTRETQL